MKARFAVKGIQKEAMSLLVKGCCVCCCCWGAEAEPRLRVPVLLLLMVLPPRCRKLVRRRRCITRRRKKEEEKKNFLLLVEVEQSSQPGKSALLLACLPVSIVCVFVWVCVLSGACIKCDEGRDGGKKGTTRTTRGSSSCFACLLFCACVRVCVSVAFGRYICKCKSPTAICDAIITSPPHHPLRHSIDALPFTHTYTFSSSTFLIFSYIPHTSYTGTSSYPPPSHFTLLVHRLSVVAVAVLPFTLSLCRQGRPPHLLLPSISFQTPNATLTCQER